MAADKKKILFVAEAVTLAHVARPLVLSAALDHEHFEVGFACDPGCRWLLPQFNGGYFELPSVTREHFVAALARGAPVYDEAILRRYVRDDIAVLDAAQPDVIVGDFRLSLSISARLARIPYLGISNCYWSPYWRPAHYPVPDLMLTRILPLRLADWLFQLARPIGFALHSRPLNRVRRSYGLADLGGDLRRVYTDADHVLYADILDLFSGVNLPSHHHIIGPLVWSPPVPVPDWWNRLPENRPVVYVTLGSSGQSRLLGPIMQSLAALDVTVIAATAGGEAPSTIPANAYVAAYLPGDEAARRARVVICNGGSPSSHQALVAGVPVIGIAGNLDQFLNMGTLVSAGAGEIMRADRFSGSGLAVLVNQMLCNDAHASQARRIAAAAARAESATTFPAVLSTVMQRGGDFSEGARTIAGN